MRHQRSGLRHRCVTRFWRFSAENAALVTQVTQNLISIGVEEKTWSQGFHLKSTMRLSRTRQYAKGSFCVTCVTHLFFLADFCRFRVTQNPSVTQTLRRELAKAGFYVALLLVAGAANERPSRGDEYGGRSGCGSARYCRARGRQSAWRRVFYIKGLHSLKSACGSLLGGLRRSHS